MTTKVTQIIIDDGSGTPITFEFDSGYTLHVPIFGALPGGIVDGDLFVINDGRGRIRTFAFDSDGTFVDGDDELTPHHPLIACTPTAPPDALS